MITLQIYKKSSRPPNFALASTQKFVNVLFLLFIHPSLLYSVIFMQENTTLLFAVFSVLFTRERTVEQFVRLSVKNFYYYIYNNNSQMQFFFGNCSTVRSFALSHISLPYCRILSVLHRANSEQLNS